MQFFNGQEHAKILDKKIKEFTAKNKPSGTLAIIQIGDNAASSKYVTIKERVAKELDVPIRVFKLDSNKLQSLEVITRGSDIIYSPANTGVIIQLPLPKPRFYSLLTKIPYEKDVDMLSEGAKRKFYSGDLSRPSPIVRSIEYFIESNNIEIKGKKVLVVGLGELVGKPAEFYLKNRGADVYGTEDYSPSLAKEVELIILSAGVPKLIDGCDLPKGCNVIDFGFSAVDGVTVGDLDLSSDLDHLGIISPSPGGMGPLVVRFLLMNHLGI